MNPPTRDTLVLDERRLDGTAKRRKARELIFGALLVANLGLPVAFTALSADPVNTAILVGLWFFSLAALLTWVAVFVRDEPQLARGAVILVALVAVVFGVSRMRVAASSEATSPAATPIVVSANAPAAKGPATPASGSSAAPQQAPAKLASAILGKWERPGTSSRIEFQPNGTAISVDDAGNPELYNYTFLSNGDLQLDANAAPVRFSNLSIEADKLSMVAPDGKRFGYVRGKSKSDINAVYGTWHASANHRSAGAITFATGSLTFNKDGSFNYSEGDSGRWGLLDNLILAYGKSGKQFRIIVLPDKLSGQESDPSGPTYRIDMTRE